MSNVATMKCQNQACEDGWIGLRNLTAPPRPCLDCNPDAAALAERSGAKLKEFARWMDAPPREIIADLSSRIEAARGEVARLTEEMARKDAAFDAHVAVTNQISANAIRVADNNTRLTAEVERLEGREREAAQLFYRLLAGEFMESSARVWLAGCES